MQNRSRYLPPGHYDERFGRRPEQEADRQNPNVNVPAPTKETDHSLEKAEFINQFSGFEKNRSLSNTVDRFSEQQKKQVPKRCR